MKKLLDHLTENSNDKKKLPLKASWSTLLDWKQKNVWKIEVNILEGRKIFLVDLLNYI